MNRQCDIFSDKMPRVGITTEYTGKCTRRHGEDSFFPEQQMVDHHEGDHAHDHGDDHSRGYQSNGVHGTKVIVLA
jgi:hypothetical protein